MFLSNFLLLTSKEVPISATIASHIYSLRAGLVMQLASGLYSWLPLGLRVMNRIEHVIRKEMANIHSQEILMPIVQPADLWHKSGRYEAYGKEMARFIDRGERELLLAPTHEEVATDIFKQRIKSYKELPQNWYHIQWKFRDEIRPRSGIMRSREFLMKDGYSFDIDEAGAITTYDKMYLAYFKIFSRLGLRCVPVVTNDSGPIGGALNHEFHVVTATGDDSIVYDSRFDKLSVNQIIEELRSQKMFGSIKGATEPTNDIEISEGKSIEVGHIFYFGQKYSQALDAKVVDSENKTNHVHMGSYGIGVTRLVGAIIEASHDDAGIIWPISVAPFIVGVIDLINDNSVLRSSISERLRNAGIDFLYDDTTDNAGIKFNRMDLIGLPWQLIAGNKHEGKLELKRRSTGERQILGLDECVDLILKSIREAQSLGL